MLEIQRSEFSFQWISIPVAGSKIIKEGKKATKYVPKLMTQIQVRHTFLVCRSGMPHWDSFSFNLCWRHHMFLHDLDYKAFYREYVIELCLSQYRTMPTMSLNLRLFPFILSWVMSFAIDHNQKEHVEMQKFGSDLLWLFSCSNTTSINNTVSYF